MMTRRGFIAATGLATTATTVSGLGIGYREVPKGERPEQSPDIAVMNPRGRSPASFIIDDSTCLVNMGHYCMPQFGQVYPDRDSYKKPWQQWPREIPDRFVRKFGEWCRDNGVKGKYSIVPYPACVGCVDRFLPGWSHRQLQDSLQLVRDLMVPDWDIHPEMVTHTRVIDLKTGRPMEEASPATMENSWPREPKSVDEMAEYIAYALRILKNAGLPCEGFTTPGGMGNLVKSELSLGGMEAIREVFNPEVPHYFKYLETGSTDIFPRVEHASDLDSDDPKCMVNVIAGTGDWFGGWDGVSYGQLEPSVDRLITADGKAGRMVELIERGEPAIMLCHWPGMWNNGIEIGFRIFRGMVERMNSMHGERILWMKCSDIARYWAAKELTTIRSSPGRVILKAPFATERYTLQWNRVRGIPSLKVNQQPVPLKRIEEETELDSGTWTSSGEDTIICFDLERGTSEIEMR